MKGTKYILVNYLLKYKTIKKTIVHIIIRRFTIFMTCYGKVIKCKQNFLHRSAKFTEQMAISIHALSINALTCTM